MAEYTDSYQLALHHFQNGEVREAERLCWRIVQAAPEHAEAINLLALAVFRNGNASSAAEIMRRAVQVDPGNPSYQCNLGVICAACGRLDEALASYQEALRLLPDYAVACNNMGLVLRDMGKLEEAITCFRRALQSLPDFADAHNNLGNALRDQGAAQAAANHYREAIRIKPNAPHFFHNLAVVLSEQGELQEAAWCYQRALQIDPHFVRAYYDLSRLAAQGCHDFSVEEINHIRLLAIQSGRTSLERSLACFALAGITDRPGSHDEAFMYYQRANEWRKDFLRQQEACFDVEMHRRQINAVIDFFNADYFKNVPSQGNDSELPVFIVGMPRSGTSLVEQILASHPQVVGAGELWDISKLVSALANKFRGYYPGCLGQLDTKAWRMMADSYLDRLRSLSNGSLRVTDKMPLNFLHLGLIRTLFPRAPVIHCRRDPFDTCLSCYFQNFESINFTTSLEDIGHYYREYERLMNHWQTVLPGPMLEVHYEDLVANQEAVTRRMVAFCGLEWNGDCLRFHENPRPVRTASFLQVRRPIYSSSVGRWKRYAAHLGPLFNALGVDSRTT